MRTAIDSRAAIASGAGIAAIVAFESAGAAIGYFSGNELLFMAGLVVMMAVYIVAIVAARRYGFRPAVLGWLSIGLSLGFAAFMFGVFTLGPMQTPLAGSVAREVTPEAVSSEPSRFSGVSAFVFQGASADLLPAISGNFGKKRSRFTVRPVTGPAWKEGDAVRVWIADTRPAIDRERPLSWNGNALRIPKRKLGSYEYFEKLAHGSLLAREQSTNGGVIILRPVEDVDYERRSAGPLALLYSLILPGGWAVMSALFILAISAAAAAGSPRKPRGRRFGR